MARKSLSLQLAELREYTARLEIELAGLKEIAARPRAPAAKPDFALRREAARRLCQQTGARSASAEQVDRYLASMA